MISQRLLLDYAAHKGLSVMGTGGGCEALTKDLGDDVYCLITDADAGIPEALDEHHCALGLYAGDGDCVAMLLRSATAQECIDMLSRLGE